MDRLLTGVLFLPALLLFGGCAALLPVSKSYTEARWQSFGEVKAVFDQIETHETTKEQLRQMRFDPARTANIKILTFPEILAMFMPNSALNMADMDPGLRDCVENSGDCLAYQLNIEKLDARRHGSVILDLFRFKRETHYTGWIFTSLVVMVEDKVVYKEWGGTRQIDEQLYQRNPLGVLQAPAATTMKDAVPLVGGLL